MSDERLFVYGTLRHDTGSVMAAFLARYAEPLGPAVFQGVLYDLGAYPATVASDRPEDRVVGEVYLLKDPARVLAALDDYEGCAADSPEPTEYVRRIQVVQNTNGLALEAWVYLYNRPTLDLPRIRSGDYLHPCRT